MLLTEELHIGKPLDPGHELALSLLLTREHLARFLDEGLFRPAGLTDQQFNVLRILQGGPIEGYAIGEIRRRVISRSADVPRLVDRLVGMGLVGRRPDAKDRRSCRVVLTPEGKACQDRLAPSHAALLEELAGLLLPEDRARLVDLLQQVRDGIRSLAGPLAVRN